MTDYRVCHPRLYIGCQVVITRRNGVVAHFWKQRPSKISGERKIERDDKRCFRQYEPPGRRYQGCSTSHKGHSPFPRIAMGNGPISGSLLAGSTLRGFALAPRLRNSADWAALKHRGARGAIV